MRSLFKKAMKKKKGNLPTISEEGSTIVTEDLNISEVFLSAMIQDDSETDEVGKDLAVESPEEMYHLQIL